MKCDTINELLSEYIDDELSPEQRREVEAHLEGCESCRRELESLKATVALVGSLSQVSAPEDLATKVTDGLDAETKGKIIWPSRWVKVFVPLAAAAALLIVFSLPFVTQQMADKEAMAPTAAPAKRYAVATRPEAEMVEEETAKRESAAHLREELQIAKAPEEKRALGFRERLARAPRGAADDEAKKSLADSAKRAPAFPARLQKRKGGPAHAVTGDKAQEAVPALAVREPDTPSPRRVAGKSVEPMKAADESRTIEKARARADAKDVPSAPTPAPAKPASRVERVTSGKIAAKKAATPADAVQVAVREKAAPRPEKMDALEAEPKATVAIRKAAKAEGGESRKNEAPSGTRLALENGVAAKAAAARPSSKAKAGEGDAAAVRHEQVTIVSSAPAADMARVRSLLETKYGLGRPDRDREETERLVAAKRIVAVLPADRYQEFLGELIRQKFTLARPLAQGAASRETGLLQQKETGQAAVAQQVAPATIHLTIIFQPPR